jgi:hypothetical protein
MQTVQIGLVIRNGRISRARLALIAWLAYDSSAVRSGGLVLPS